MRGLFLGSGPFGIPALRRLQEVWPDLVVGTVPDAPQGRQRKLAPCPLKKAALESGLEIFETDRLKGKSGREFLQLTGAELVMTADIRLILGRSFLEGVPLGCFNLHGSILPRWRGAAPIVRALLAGDEEIGVSLYRMVPALDAGPVVAVHRWAPPENVTADQAEEYLSERAADLLIDNLAALQSGQPPLLDQDDALATFAPKVEKSEGWIQWGESADHIDRQIRALQPWPKTRSLWSPAQMADEASETLILHQAAALESSSDRQESAVESPGTVVEVSEEGIVVVCGHGLIRIERLQRAGKKPLQAVEFLRGLKIAPGDSFLDPPQQTKGESGR
ncbi:MAG: methionyl-tRNA formyltransferase [Planctomycetia bacterium TMED53]|nr:MAG: methionyl-tRNA formyltransferase [Planctomycetia bacterium TMED53]